jgi:hypothetical protein
VKNVNLDKLEAEVSKLEDEQRGVVLGPDGHEPTIVRVRRMVEERGFQMAKEQGRTVTQKEAGLDLLKRKCPSDEED